MAMKAFMEPIGADLICEDPFDSIDDLLDFPNDDDGLPIVDAWDNCAPLMPPPATPPAMIAGENVGGINVGCAASGIDGRAAAVSGDGINSENDALGLCDDIDIANLEWLSNFFEDADFNFDLIPNSTPSTPDTKPEHKTPSLSRSSSLQNMQGWSPLQEVICTREEQIAKIILRHYQALAWVKWCHRMPRIVAAMNRMRDFYMKINFHFESSMIPFISRIAPSDTYKIWKRGSNLRVDMTLSGFDGLKIKRAEQSILFLGGGSVDRKVDPGSLYIISHKDKEVLNALDGAGARFLMLNCNRRLQCCQKTNVLRPGFDVTRSVLVPQMNWRKQQRTGHGKLRCTICIMWLLV